MGLKLTPLIFADLCAGFAIDDILIKSNVQAFFTKQRNLDTKGAAVTAQPLYVPGLTISGKIHNVVYIATESAAVFAYDAGVGPASVLRTCCSA